MGRRHAVLAAGYVEQSLFEVDLIPAERHQFADSQAVAISEEDQRRISVAVPTNPARGADQLVDLLRRQVLARSPFTVRDAPWRGYFPVFGGWRRLADEREHRPARA